MSDPAATARFGPRRPCPQRREHPWQRPACRACGSSPAPAEDSGVSSGQVGPLLRTESLTRHFKIGGAMSKQHPARRGRHQRDHRRARDRRAGGRERQRQIHRRPAARQALQADQRRDLLPGQAAVGLRGRRDVLRYRGDVPMVFQDPFASFNPVFRVSHGVMRCLKLHRPELSAQQRREEAERVFTAVGLTPAAEVLRAVPARAERRPAAAGRLRPGPGAAAEADPGRRARLDAGRLDPHRAAQPDGRSA